MGRLLSIALLGLGLLGAPAGGASAAPERPFPLRGPFDLVADEVEYERERELYVARGNVRITQGDRTLSADWVSLSNLTRVGVASGNVVVVEDGDTLHAAFLQFDVDTLQGVVYQGRLDSPESRFRLEGREVRRTGEQTYRFDGGRFTTCRCPDPGRDPWSIRAERADLEVGGYGTARNTTFEVLGVPVLWLPWMIYPLKTERQTGFLFPEIGASTVSGGDFGLPFFWAVADNLNLTLTPSYLSKRGLKPSLELEYVFGERSAGELFASVIDDHDIDPDDPSTPFDEFRWAVGWLHDQFLPSDWRFKVDAKAFSDNLYPFDFSEFSRHRVDRFLESVGFVNRHFGRSDRLGLAGSVQAADDLQNPDDVDRDDFLLQRLPQLTLSALPRRLDPLLGLVGSFDIRYTNFQSVDRAEDDLPEATVVDDLFLDTGIDAIPDGRERNAAGVTVPGDAAGDNFLTSGGPEQDGRFQEGEPLVDAGQRLVVTPRLGLPLRLGDLAELYPEVGYHGSFYETREHGFEQRSFVTGRLDLRARLRRSFALPLGGGAAVHLLEPRFGWALVSETSQSSNPLFVPRTILPQNRIRELELTNVTLDPADRVESFNGVVLGLGNRIFRRRTEDGLSRLWADVALSAQYDFSDSEFGFVILEGQSFPFPRTQARFHVSFDPEESRLAEGLLRLGWSSEAGHELGLGYRYLREIPRFAESFPFDDERYDDFEQDFQRVNQLSFAARAAITGSWALTYRGAYSFESSITLANEAGIEYLSRCRCWAIRLEIEDDRSRGYQFSVRYRLIGLGDDTVRPFGQRGGGGGRGGFLDVL